MGLESNLEAKSMWLWHLTTKQSKASEKHRETVEATTITGLPGLRND
eukprot:CAMPEP_0194751792 /NCGR_PEP_ID=MMETSP0323_2-20130528/5741_1 /TAXON_ID=2866 ORGANISM="Crypthecodinium cohnii, Strain Seligo" /NCGR_SAMPLE_ID=MMETSP0323_2 /ASSEMBLY_ACC=CAM_ASM_000346 /LENGTH=46 /DNA_ID= /DNA_START= /DNA_END= /DNA_ORIENTATION=